jgi:hypothetical protein
MSKLTQEEWQAAMEKWDRETFGPCVDIRARRLKRLEDDREALLEALEYALEASWDGISDPVWADKARAAIKKARGE